MCRISSSWVVGDCGEANSTDSWWTRMQWKDIGRESGVAVRMIALNSNRGIVLINCRRGSACGGEVGRVVSCGRVVTRVGDG